jgi:hypothetical protein
MYTFILRFRQIRLIHFGGMSIFLLRFRQNGYIEIDGKTVKKKFEDFNAGVKFLFLRINSVID